MMIQSILIFCMLILMNANSTKNPMSLCVTLTAVSSLNFIILSMATSTSLISLIIMMVFLGGIIMMFMILCSIMPNSMPKTKKDKKFFVYIIGTLLATASTPAITNWGPKNQEFKWFLETSTNTIMVVAIMLIYFMMFNKSILGTKNSMRTLEC